MNGTFFALAAHVIVARIWYFNYDFISVKYQLSKKWKSHINIKLKKHWTEKLQWLFIDYKPILLLSFLLWLITALIVVIDVTVVKSSTLMNIMGIILFFMYTNIFSSKIYSRMFYLSKSIIVLTIFCGRLFMLSKLLDFNLGVINKLLNFCKM